MPRIFFKPHKILIPTGLMCFANSGETILNIALKNNINIEHSCNKSCACSTCHCIIKEGFFSLNNATEQEENLLDKAWGLNEYSRLSCQTKLGNKDLVIEIPIYTRNNIF